MNAKLISLSIAAALFVSTSAFAAQPNGRDSVYATGTSFPSAQVARAHTGNGRGSVYAADLPAPTPKTAVGEVKARFGRA